MKPSLLSLENNFDHPDQNYSEAERFVTSALDAMSAHIAILDENGYILEVNKAWRDFADSNGSNDPTYGIGTNYLNVCEVPADDNAKDTVSVAKGIRDVMDSKINEFYREYPCHSPTERRWYVMRVARFTWYGRMRLIISHQNVSELKETQLQLAESRAYTQAVLDNVVDGIVTVDVSGRIETINPAAAHIFGYTMDELIGQKIEKLVAGEYRYPKNGFMVNFTIDIRRLGHEIVGQHKDGSFFPMYIAMNHMRIGNRDLYTGIVQDITERKRLEAEVLEKERLSIALDKEHELRLLKDRFISVMSHELRTPLASILLASDMLKKYGDRVSEAEKQESIEAIETQVQHLSELVKDVLTISKTEFIAQELNLEIYDLETYLRDIIEELEWAHRKTHRLVFKGVNRRVEVRIDRKLLRHAIVNLLTNAIKYSPEGGEVLMSLKCVKGKAIVRVSDHGIGIPADDLPRLFEAFHRAGNVEKFQGTGLGLAIAKQAVEAHEGSIEVESQIGVGTTFTIRLPLVIKTPAR